MPVMSGMRMSVTRQPLLTVGQAGKKGARRVVKPHGQAGRAQQEGERLAHRLVVIDDMHDPVIGIDATRFGRRLQGEAEDGAAAGIRLGPHLPAMRLDDALGDR